LFIGNDEVLDPQLLYQMIVLLAKLIPLLHQNEVTLLAIHFEAIKQIQSCFPKQNLFSLV